MSLQEELNMKHNVIPFPKGRKPRSDRNLRLRGTVVIHLVPRLLARAIVRGPWIPPDLAA